MIAPCRGEWREVGHQSRPPDNETMDTMMPIAKNGFKRTIITAILITPAFFLPDDIGLPRFGQSLHMESRVPQFGHEVRCEKPISTQ